MAAAETGRGWSFANGMNSGHCGATLSAVGYRSGRGHRTIGVRNRRAVAATPLEALGRDDLAQFDAIGLRVAVGDSRQIAVKAAWISDAASGSSHLQHCTRRR